MRKSSPLRTFLLRHFMPSCTWMTSEWTLATGGAKTGAAVAGMPVSAKVAAKPPAHRPETSFFICRISLEGDVPCCHNGPHLQWFQALHACATEQRRKGPCE